MRRVLVSCALFAGGVVSSSASAQTMRTEAPCSPVIERTQGLISNVTINFTGGCTSGISPAQLQQIIDDVMARRAIPPDLLEKYEQLGQRFGVNDMAVATFFKVMGEKKVPTEDLNAKLREIAARHLTLLKQVETVPGADPQLDALKKSAVAAIAAGDYAEAQALLEKAFDADLVAARKAQDAANKALDVANRRFLTAAKTKADLGYLKLSQLQYAAATREFQAAADLVPASEPTMRARHLLHGVFLAASLDGKNSLAVSALTEVLRIQEQVLGADHTNVASGFSLLASTYQQQGHYAEAEASHKRALAIREKAFGPEHPDVAPGLKELALLYQAQGRHAEAELLSKRALAIKEKAFGPEHPDVAAVLQDLASLYLEQGRYAEAELLSKRALAIKEKAFGPEHPGLAAVLQDLASLYLAQGRYTEAEPFSKRAVAITGNVLGLDLNDTTAVLRRLQKMLHSTAAPADVSRGGQSGTSDQR